jgi:predicted MPP superfamily phosphohydrolase
MVRAPKPYAASPTGQASSERDACIYAIGDIHGRIDLLDRVIEAIQRDMGTWSGPALTVTLGDYVDRGPQSREVLDRLAQNPFPTPYVALKGNHEALLEDFLANPTVGEYWRRQGGLRIPTIASGHSDPSRPPVPIDRDQLDGTVRCIS